LFIEKEVDIGLKSNIYEFSSGNAEMKHKVKKMEESIKTKKLDWVSSNH